MKIAILGGGSVALANACFLTDGGHEVRIWSALKDETEAIARAGGITSSGALSGTYPVAAAKSVKLCVEAAALVMVCAPAFAHRPIMVEVAPWIEPGQTIVLHPVSGLGSVVMARLLAERGIQTPIVDVSTSLLTCRKSGPTRVKILTVKKVIELAVLPASGAPDAHALLTGLYGPRFRLVDNVLAVSLGNHNPVYHVPPLLCNLSRAELREDWTIWDGITPGIARLVELLDGERLEVAGAYGVSTTPVIDYFRDAHGAQGDNLHAVFRSVSRILKGPTGPQEFNHRFITEDVPYGLVFFYALGEQAQVPMPLTYGFIDICSRLYDRDFVAEGHTLEALGLAGLDTPAILRIVTEGVTQ